LCEQNPYICRGRRPRRPARNNIMCTNFTAGGRGRRPRRPKEKHYPLCRYKPLPPLMRSPSPNGEALVCANKKNSAYFYAESISPTGPCKRKLSNPACARRCPHRQFVLPTSFISRKDKSFRQDGGGLHSPCRYMSSFNDLWV